MAWPVVHDCKFEHTGYWCPVLRGLPSFDLMREPWRTLGDPSRPGQTVSVKPYKDSQVHNRCRSFAFVEAFLLRGVFSLQPGDTVVRPGRFMETIRNVLYGGLQDEIQGDEMRQRVLDIRTDGLTVNVAIFSWVCQTKYLDYHRNLRDACLTDTPGARRNLARCL